MLSADINKYISLLFPQYYDAIFVCTEDKTYYSLFKYLLHFAILLLS